ncbi:MAG: imidazole glycerol phosphate synthase subunit HisH [Burkholderiales bacterium]|jgi:glutamine amidotransferase|nr:imidazole glycerol phosphate synthase subunit HisH [Burkholderiales bacterium]
MRVVIIDTGCANLSSLKYAVLRLGYTPAISTDPHVIQNADRVFLPGVGAAAAAMREINARGLVETIRACTRPMLGICMGMQLLGSQSEEGNAKTLGVMDISVTRLHSKGLPLPHMGWNTLSSRVAHPLFEGIDDQAYFYFVHSYAMPVSSLTLAQTVYGQTFSSVVARDRFFGTQFHPERSGAAGARLIRNFLEVSWT